jgi:hypothetical protein
MIKFELDLHITMMYPYMYVRFGLMFATTAKIMNENE